MIVEQEESFQQRTLAVHIGEINQTALLDGGAVVNCISEELTNQLKLKPVQCNKTLVHAEGDTFTIKGEIEISFTIEGAPGTTLKKKNVSSPQTRTSHHTRITFSRPTTT